MVRLENALMISLQDLLKMSWRHFKDVFKTSWRCLEDALKRFWRHLKDIWPRQIYWSWPRLLEDVLKTSSEDVRLRRTYSSWSRRLEDVFKTSSEGEDERRLQDVFKTSSSRRMFAGMVFHPWKFCMKCYGSKCFHMISSFNKISLKPISITLFISLK